MWLPTTKIIFVPHQIERYYLFGLSITFLHTALRMEAMFITEIASRPSTAAFTLRLENSAVIKGYYDKVLKKIIIAF